MSGNYFASANVANIYNTSQYSGNITTWPYMVATPNVASPPLNNFYIPTANLRYVNGIGLALFNSVELQLGGQRIDKHYSEWWDIWSELTETAEHLQGYNTMVGRYDQTYYKNNFDITQKPLRRSSSDVDETLGEQLTALIFQQIAHPKS
ncbi:MAG: hypothetical protein EBX62_06370 [Betaproteobacteria bacterium]|nr:hypothetical protein [Betaproteobacteria bacterium]